MNETRQFLDVLYRDCTGHVECRALPSAQRAWTTPGTWAPLGPFLNEQTAARQQLYVGVCTRRSTENGRADNLQELPGVWVDFDDTPATVTPRLTTFPFPCSLQVHSGLRLHGYWLLREPLDVREPAALARAASVLRRLSQHLGGDAQATDPARVLRLPGTVNTKYDSPRRVTLAAVTDAAVNLSELEDFLPTETIVRNEWTIEGVPKGQRNDTLYRVCRSWRLEGRELPDLYREAEAFNKQWCRPPLEQTELKKIVVAAFTQKDRPDFVAPVIIHDATPPPPASSGDGVYVNLGTVEAEAVTWLYPDMIAARKAVMLSGDPGLGKSMITTDWAARFTTGAAWPDGSRAPKGRVLFLIAEDGLGDTVRPRVDAHNGDPSGIEVLTAVVDGTNERPFSLERDLPALAEGFRRFEPKLLVIDPLNSYLGANVDSYRDASVRHVLSPLIGMAEKYDCVLLWVSHLTKAQDVKALYRPGASIAFLASARIAFILGEHPQEADTLVLAQMKNNLAPKAPSLSLQIQEGRVCWGGVVDLTADQILQTPDPEEAELSFTADGVIARLKRTPDIWPLDVRVAYAEGRRSTCRNARCGRRRAGPR